MTEQIPLYVGIPLAALCVAAVILIVAFVIAILNDRS